MLVVISIVGLVVISSSNVFFSTLRTNTKTQISTNLKQKGDYALTVMERMIRQAYEINDCSPNNLTLIYKDGQETVFSCSSSQLASNSAVLIDSINCGDFNFNCDLPQVDINFILSQGGSDPLPFQRTSMKFQTTVTARNL